jgi:pyruvate dehydrogenase E1 component alpha subunit
LVIPRITTADHSFLQVGEELMAEMAKAQRKRKPGRPPKAASGATAMNDLPARDDLVDMYRDMLLIRRFEEKAGQLYGMGQIGGFCHLYIGQEAVVVGLQ